MRKKAIWAFLLFILITIGGYFSYLKLKSFLLQRDTLDASYRPPVISGTASLHMDNFKITETDGVKLSWLLNSKTADMYKREGVISFDKVQTKVYSDAMNSYEIFSDKGIYYTDTDKIAMSGNVGILTSNGYKFSTDSVLYYAKDKKIISNQAVTAYGPKGGKSPLFVKGVGLRGDIDSGDFEFTKEVKTYKNSEDKTANIEVRSKRAIFNTKGNKIEFKKKVLVKKDDMDIQGDNLELLYSELGSINQLRVTDGVIIKLKDKESKEVTRTAICGEAIIETESGKVVLLDKPELRYTDDVIIGERIVLFTNNDEVYVDKVKADVTERGIK